MITKIKQKNMGKPEMVKAANRKKMYDTSEQRRSM